jgi:hypothetical protein
MLFNSWMCTYREQAFYRLNQKNDSKANASICPQPNKGIRRPLRLYTRSANLATLAKHSLPRHSLTTAGQLPWTTEIPAAGLSLAGKCHHFVDQKNCS